ncbi:MAG TPA: sporulation protein YqfC [Verrucomicrobiae bacterium]|nr:sporulation protein YqfC [Verrucomicrobiae bacterium]
MVLKKIQANLGSALDIPKDVLMDVPKITMVGDVQIWIENHTGIIEYNAERVRVNSTLGVITVEGNNLVLVELLPTEIKLEGKLQQIKFGEE